MVLMTSYLFRVCGYWLFSTKGKKKFCTACLLEHQAILDDKDHYAPLVKCPECDSLKVEILNGRDIVVKNIVIEKPDDN